MSENTRNITHELVKYMLQVTAGRRSSADSQSCDYVYCLFFLDNPNLTALCDVQSSPMNSTEPEESYLKTIAKSIHLYIYPLFIFLGILGNKLSCFVMLMHIRRCSYSANLYLILLAAVDCLFLWGSVCFIVFIKSNIIWTN